MALPSFTGGGAIVKAVTKADDVADAVKTVKTVKKVSKTTDALSKTSDVAKAINNTVDTTNTAKRGWNVGDDISNLTRAGKEPSWSTVRQRYWKNQANSPNPPYSPENLARMKKGLAPIGSDGFSMELHHPLGREGANFYNFHPLTRTKHRTIHYGNLWW